MIAVGSAAFLLFGVALVLLGACQPEISASLELDLAAFGQLGAALALGIGIGVLAAGPLVDRLPRRPIFLASTLIAAIALLGVEPHMSFARALAHVALMGVGTGIYDTLLNAVTVERHGDSAAGPVALLHAMVPVGAIAAPLGVQWGLESGGWIDVFRAVGAAYLAISLWVACVPMPAPQRSARAHASCADPRPFARPAFLALCGVGFAYVGIEAAVTLFAVPYAEGALGQEAASGRRAISAFWLGILLCRLAIGALRLPLGAGVMTGSGTAGALLLGAGIGLGWSALDILLGAVGIAIGAVFPLMITLAGQRVPQARGLATGLVAGAGSVGGFVVPWLTGALGDSAGIEQAVGALAIWSLGMGAAAWLSGR